MTDIVSQFAQILLKLKEKTNNIMPVVHLITAVINEAIERNFRENGNWDGNVSNINIFSGGSNRWQARKPAYVTRITKKVPNAKPLEVTEVLRRSIEVVPLGQSKIGITAKVPYAAIHQFGGRINSPGGTPYIATDKGAVFISNRKAKQLEAKGHKVKRTKPHIINMPARPYIVLTPEDVQEIIIIISKLIS